MITVLVDNGVYEEGIEIPDDIHPVMLENLLDEMIPDNTPCIITIDDGSEIVVYDNIPEGVN